MQMKVMSPNGGKGKGYRTAYCEGDNNSLKWDGGERREMGKGGNKGGRRNRSPAEVQGRTDREVMPKSKGVCGVWRLKGLQGRGRTSRRSCREESLEV